MVARQIVLHHFHRFELFEARLLGNFVLALVGVVLEVADVGDVAHVAHLVAEVLQIAEEDVESDGGAGMTQMAVAIDGRTTDIHAHTAFVEGLEGLLGPGEGVVDCEHGEKGI